MIVGGVWVPNPPDEEKEWVPDRAVTRAALDEIQARHEATCQRCPLCAQLMNRGDDFGLCSKVDEPHAVWRRQVLARENGPNPSRRRSRRVPAFN